MIGRRDFALGIGASLLLGGRADARRTRCDPSARLRAVERARGGRLGAFVLDTGSGRSFGWREHERFCHCSTFKLSLAALTLREADAGRLDLAEMLPFNQTDVIAHSPVVAKDFARGRLPIQTLAEAVQVKSDNAAANLLMRRLGGPGAVTRFWREIGDTKSRLDDYEPTVNVIPAGTEENSTTPQAMAGTVRRIVLGDVLSATNRDRLRGWMAATQSGLARIRAAAPDTWHGYDKTGTGMREGVGNKTNDLAVLVPANGRSPLIVIGYFETPHFSAQTRPEDEAVLKTLGEIAVAWAA